MCCTSALNSTFCARIEAEICFNTYPKGLIPSSTCLPYLVYLLLSSESAAVTHLYDWLKMMQVMEKQETLWKISTIPANITSRTRLHSSLCRVSELQQQFALIWSLNLRKSGLEAVEKSLNLSFTVWEPDFSHCGFRLLLRCVSFYCVIFCETVFGAFNRWCEEVSLFTLQHNTLCGITIFLIFTYTNTFFIPAYALRKRVRKYI